VDSTKATTNGATYDADSTLGPCYTGAGGCKASIKVGFVQAAATFTRSQCANGANLAAQHGLETAKLPGETTAVLSEIPKSPTLEQALEAVEQMKKAGANVIVGCFYLGTRQKFIQALEVADYTPLAMSISASHTSTYQAAISTGWWQGEYAVGPSPWHRTSPEVGAVSGMTSTQFFDKRSTRSALEARR
jgi:hypothetical protein